VTVYPVILVLATLLPHQKAHGLGSSSPLLPVIRLQGRRHLADLRRGVQTSNGIFSVIGIDPVGWLTDVAWALVSVFVASVWLQLGYAADPVRSTVRFPRPHEPGIHLGIAGCRCLREQ
jgi:hypothetical protein